MKDEKNLIFAQEPWPNDVKLFQPYEVEQILLPDNASCLAVQAFLKMCNLPFEVEMRWNAEFMSPSGRVPFIKCGAFVVSELEPIVQFAANKGVSLCGRLSTEEKAEMRAYMSLITNVLVNAELYISWIDEDTFNAVTKVRNSSVYPWPLGWLQTRSKRNAVAKRLKALHWHDKTLDQVLADVEQCCNSLSQRLGDRDFFFGTPTPLDALVYGHTRAILSANGPKAALMIKPITSSLLRHILRMKNLTKMELTSHRTGRPCVRPRVHHHYHPPALQKVSRSCEKARDFGSFGQTGGRAVLQEAIARGFQGHFNCVQKALKVPSTNNFKLITCPSTNCFLL
ncbi:metaxin-2 isoform X2 [Amyelois transitella]|uniref:metaxin-2 isoform X2 n=1 Tax=Amyelois transitella TaxID=680683 RepID=UPI0029902EC4|nr:metaxin-2 isoform X2 [Amyelois transitella]